MIVQIIQKLKSQYDDWRERRFLRKHGCKNREQYNLKYDPLHNPLATRLMDFYRGYKYIYCFENHKHQIYYQDLAYFGSYVVTEWCRENLSGKWRFDVHRAIKYPSTGNEWEMNDIGGGDYIFAAFTDERDYMLFTLRWS